MAAVLIVIAILVLSGGSLWALDSGSSSTPSLSPADASASDPISAFLNSFGNSTEVTMPIPAAWPGDSNDPVWQCCYAIAHAEGFDQAGSVPARLHNPGDLSDGAQTFGSEFHSGSNVTKFPDDATGWKWLYDKVANIRDGGSSVYSPDMTWTQIAQKWAGNWQNWVSNVTGRLGVDPNSRFGDFFGV